MTSVLNVDEIAAKDGTSAATLTKQVAAKLWAKFDTSGTAALSDSFNVSALSDLGTGNTQLTAVSAFNNATYAVTALSQYQNNTGQVIAEGPSDAATNSFEIWTRTNSASAFDADINSAVVHGDLA